MSNKYLFNEEPKSFSPTIAKALCSVSKAVIMQQVHFWLHVYTKKADQRHFFDGYYWVFNSYTEWHKDLDFIPFATMKRQILELEKNGLLISSEFNKNRGDRTKWYRINYEQLTLLTTGVELNHLVQNEPPSDHFEPPSDHFEPPSDHFEPPSDHFDPLYIQSDHQCDQLIDQQKKESDFFENSYSEQKPDPISDLSKPESKDLEKTPPLPPLSAAAQKLQEQFEGRFKNKPNRYAPQGLVEAGFGEWHLGEDYDNWRPSLIKVAQQVKRELKQPCEIKDATKYLFNTARQSRIEGHWGTFKGMTKEAIAIEQAQSQRSQQQPAPIAVQEPEIIAPMPSMAREYAAKLARKAS
jgi:hypothetical protein